MSVNIKGKTVYEVEVQSRQYSGQHKQLLVVARNIGEAERKALAVAPIEIGPGRYYAQEVKIVGTIDAQTRGGLVMDTSTTQTITGKGTGVSAARAEGPHYWCHLEADAKIERLREQIKMLLSTIRMQGEQLQHLRWTFEDHEHHGRQIMLPVRTQRGNDLGPRAPAGLGAILRILRPAAWDLRGAGGNGWCFRRSTRRARTISGGNI